MASYVRNAIRYGKNLVQSEPFDVINTYFSIPTGPVGLVLSRKAGIPNIISLMGGDVIDPSKRLSPHRHFYLRALNRYLFRTADAVVAPSDNLIDNMKTHYRSGVEPRKIPFGIKRPDLYSGSRDRYGYTPDQVLIVCVGRLVPRKQMYQLIQVVEKLRDENIHLIIIGDGPLKQSLQEEAQERAVADRVTLTGYLDDAEKFCLLKMCDIYASTSQHEGFGLVFLEGMGAYLPVVAYNQGGHTDYVENEANGYVIELDDIDAFACRTRLLVRDRELRERMGRAGYRRAKEYFVENYARHYENLYSEVIAAKH
jgi:glycosyltransferase involved in cell wall biosynthesis